MVKKIVVFLMFPHIKNGDDVKLAEATGWIQPKSQLPYQQKHYKLNPVTEVCAPCFPFCVSPSED